MSPRRVGTPYDRQDLRATFLHALYAEVSVIIMLIKTQTFTFLFFKLPSDAVQTCTDFCFQGKVIETLASGDLLEEGLLVHSWQPDLK